MQGSSTFVGSMAARRINTENSNSGSEDNLWSQERDISNSFKNKLIQKAAKEFQEKNKEMNRYRDKRIFSRT